MRLVTVLREAARDLAVARVWYALAAFASFVSLVAFASIRNDSLYWPLAGLAAPLFLLPYSAYLLARDRASGMFETLLASGLRRSEYLAARCLSVFATLVASTVITVIVSVAIVAGKGADPLPPNLPRLAWFLVLAAASGATGLAIGTIGLEIATSMAVAFIVGVAWLFAAANAGDILALAPSGAFRAFVTAFLHVDPLMWALDDLGTYTHPIVVGGGRFAAFSGALILAIAAIAAAVVIFNLGHRPRLSHARVGPWATFAMAGLFLVASFSIWDFDDASAKRMENARWQSADGSITLTGYASALPSAKHSQADGSVLILSFLVQGPPGASVTLQDIHAESPFGTFPRPSSEDHVIRIPEEGPLVGRGSLELSSSFRATYLADRLPVTLFASVAGQPAELQTYVIVPPQPANPLIVCLAALAVTSITWGVARFLPRRLRASPA